MNRIEELARILDEAAIAHQPVDAFADVLSLDDAYAIQQAGLLLRTKRTGSAHVGFKVALTSPEAQAALKSPTPALGCLTENEAIPSGSIIKLDDHFAPLLETELIFRVLADFSPEATEAEIADKTEFSAGIECPDSRFNNWFGGDFPALSLAHVVSDNCLAGFIVVGTTWCKAQVEEFSKITATLAINGEVVKTGDGTEVLGNPLRAIEWLNQQRLKQEGPLQAGMLISSGTFTSPLRAQKGHTAADFSIGGRAEVTFI